MKITTFFFFTLFVCIGGFSQTVSPNKYRIDLPQNLNFSKGFTTRLIDILPILSSKLKNKDVCGDDCNSLYHVSIEISQFKNLGQDYQLASTSLSQFANSSYETYAVYSHFSFESSLIIDSAGVIVERIQVVDTSEQWSANFSEKIRIADKDNPHVNNIKIKQNATLPVDINTSIYNNNLSATALQNNSTAETSPISYLYNNRIRYTVESKHLIDVIEKKINSLKKI